MKPGVSIIIPILNEEDLIRSHAEKLLEYLKTLERPFEIVLVSNGSTDNTDALGRELEKRLDQVRFFSLAHKGVGRAFSLGAREARHELIVSMDMDLSIDLSFIPEAADLLEEYQIVVGSKKMGAQKRTLWRRGGSTAFILTARLLLGLSFEDYSIAAKAYRRETILTCLDRIDYGTSYVLDIIYHTLAGGGRAKEIPVFCEDYRASRFNLLNEALYRFKNLFLLWWNYKGGLGKP
ncbi:MAG: glycosyltransferase family 2 protein [Pseudomonadota bacterium]